MKNEPLWTLSELAAAVAAQLRRNYQASGNGQVRAVPDERAIRYYTSMGLVDRPAAMRGRTALYGRRHLAQLIAIKRLQALDKPLAEIQKTLPALDDQTLSRIAGVSLPTAARGGRADFWRTSPASAAAAGGANEVDGAASAQPAPARARVAEQESSLQEASVLQAASVAPEPVTTGFDAVWTLTLARGVTLTLQARRGPTDADADALLSAAQPLCAELLRRGLIDE